METVGQLIEAALKTKKMSTRELGRLVGRDHATIGRYIFGVTVLPTKLHQRMAGILFKSPSQRNRFLKVCAAANQNSKGLSKKKNETKKAKTAVMKKGYFAEVIYDPVFKHSSGDQPNDGRATLTQMKQMDLKTKLVSISLRIEVKKKSKLRDIDVLWIMPHEGLIFFEDFPSHGLKGRIIGFEAIPSYTKYCARNGIQRYGLIELARSAIETSDALNMLSYKDGENTMVKTENFDAWIGILESAIEFIKMGGKSNLSLSINSIRQVKEGMRFVQNGAREVESIKSQLLRYIDTLFSKLS